MTALNDLWWVFHNIRIAGKDARQLDSPNPRLASRGDITGASVNERDHTAIRHERREARPCERFGRESHWVMAEGHENRVAHECVAYHDRLVLSTGVIDHVNDLSLSPLDREE